MERVASESKLCLSWLVTAFCIHSVSVFPSDRYCIISAAPLFPAVSALCNKLGVLRFLSLNKVIPEISLARLRFQCKGPKKSLTITLLPRQLAIAIKRFWGTIRRISVISIFSSDSSSAIYTQKGVGSCLPSLTNSAQL